MKYTATCLLLLNAMLSYYQDVIICQKKNKFLKKEKKTLHTQTNHGGNKRFSTKLQMYNIFKEHYGMNITFKILNHQNIFNCYLQYYLITYIMFISLILLLQCVNI